MCCPDGVCECGGVTKYYDGLLGYEALVCQRCGEHWNCNDSVMAQENHIAEYRRRRIALTKDLLVSLKAFVRLYSREGDCRTPLINTMLRDAKEAIAKEDEVIEKIRIAKSSRAMRK